MLCRTFTYPNSNCRCRRAYTLIELVVVMAIIALVFFIAVPRFAPRLNETRLQTSARTLASFARYAHGHAALTRKNVTLHIDTVNNEYWVTTPIEEEEETWDLESLVPEMDSSVEVLGARFDLDEERSDEDDEEEGEEIFTTFLQRRSLPEGIAFAGIEFGGFAVAADEEEDVEEALEEYEIEYTPLGLKQAATVYLADNDGGEMTIIFDPISGDTRAERGHVETGAEEEELL
jgi:prepilin-type N-terminal cleavage/methylation domain-containing protein